MTAQEFAKIAAQKLEKLSVEQIKEMAAKLASDTRKEADIVLGEVLDALMGKIAEADFIAFCETI